MEPIIYIFGALNLFTLSYIAFLFKQLNSLKLNNSSKQQILQETLTSNLKLKRDYQKLQFDNDRMLKELIILQSEKTGKPIKL